MVACIPRPNVVSDLQADDPAIPEQAAQPSAVGTPPPATPAAITQPSAEVVALSGAWTAFGIGTLEQEIDALTVRDRTQVSLDGTRVEAFDTAGAWMVQRLLQVLRRHGVTVKLTGWRPHFAQLLDLVAEEPPKTAAMPPPRSLPEHVGIYTAGALEQAFAMLSFIGETAIATAGSIVRPARLRWRPILHNIQTAGFSALPIVGLLSFLLGVVVAYQGAEQLRRYGANIFVADLVGLSMLREFAPLMTAIIVAGRSGSAYAAQIGTMAVTEEIDAMRTIGIPPLDVLVLPKLFALLIALPLLTVYADVLGVFGGMVMARAQLGVGFEDFIDRLINAIDLSTYLVGIGKAPVFAAIIALIGCFQGFRTRGGADSVGRQTTKSVVQAIFLVIVADALFSVLFSVLDI
jgi:phospholipid/cholesterol/gamma-HCH transport system permease protein